MILWGDNMNKPKLVICDLDSTLIVKHQTLTPKAKEMIDTLRNNGVYFGVASGRPLYQIRYSMKSWGYDDFDVLIALNGSSLWDGIHQKEYNYYVLKKEWIKETIDLMSHFDTNPSVYRNNSQLFLKDDEMVRLYASLTSLPVEIVEKEEDLYAEDTAKIMFRVDEEIMPEVEKWVNEHPSDHFVGFKTQPGLMEFCDKRINKSYALKNFCEMQNIPLENVMAFGDTTNDNEMLKVAGTGVCMINGSEDTKAIADMITEKSCDDDGWADFMEKHVMKLL